MIMALRLAIFLGAVVSIIAIGAWLVVQGHPWFGAFVILISGVLSVHQT